MKTVIIILIFLSSNLGINAQGLDYFNFGLDSAKVEANVQSKFVMVEFFADWCINCKILEEEIFTLHDIKTLINSKCITVKLDIDQFTTMDVADQYMVKVYPSLLILNPDGSLYKSILGKKNYVELFEEFSNLPQQSSIAKF